VFGKLGLLGLLWSMKNYEVFVCFFFFFLEGDYLGNWLVSHVGRWG
jgi:hypothetical protein